MDIREILETYDNMFRNNTLTEIENYLLEHITLAKQQNYTDILFTLYNEYIGFLRDTTQKEKGLHYAKELYNLLHTMNIENTYEYATCLLNIANAYRAFAVYDQSEELFKQCESIYLQLLSKDNYSFANLYNNYGLLYQETKQYNLSIEILNKALHVIKQYKEAIIPQAITRTNLAVSYIQLNTKESYNIAIKHLNKAIETYKLYPEDFHYNATLVAYGDLYTQIKDYNKASQYYKEGLKELEKHVGKNDNYQRVYEKYKYVLSKVNKTNIELSHEYFINKAKALFIKEFKEYYDRMAFGIVGEGSDAYGYDDEISKDHDLEVGFCIWLNREDYNMIGDKVQKVYNQLFDHKGLLKYRRGVFNINDFYNHLLNTQYDLENNDDIDISDIEEYRLSLCTNGIIFEDHLGLFTRIRNKLKEYYKEDIYRQKLATALHYYSQYAQSNYHRMIERKDIITAHICKNKAIETTLDIIYLLNKEYAPYYKWKKKGLEHTKLGKKILPLLADITLLEINKKEQTILIFEEIAKIIKEELITMKYIKDKGQFLEDYIPEILNEKSEEIIENIIKIEWNMFDKVENIGGRASCQNNYKTFYIMRKSQYMTWNKELLENYLNDLKQAQNKGWNIITEKYARMMESTSIEEYNAIKQHLPVLEESRIKIQENIIGIQVNWMEELKKQYPLLADNARSIKTSEDTIYNTSYETYLRGELSTYSSKTLTLYGYMIVDKLKNNINLAYETMLNTAKLYGYSTLEEAQEYL